MVLSTSTRPMCAMSVNSMDPTDDVGETVVALIGHTPTAAGLRVKAKLDTRRYATGAVVTHAEMRSLALHPHAFHGNWNVIERRPRPS